MVLSGEKGRAVVRVVVSGLRVVEYVYLTVAE
jgi:hypothetical protein